MTDAEFKATVAAAQDGDTIIVPHSIDFGESALPITFTKSVTVKCEGERFTLRRVPWDYDMISIAAGVTVRIENVIFDGRLTRGRFTTLNGGTLVLGQDATLKDFCPNYYQGGIYLQGASHLVMEEGSEISGFYGSNYGTAVLVENTSVFDMKGGIIHGCKGSYATAHRGYDGVVYIQNGSPTFNMSGGLITGNTSESCSAGVIVWVGTMNLSGTATITNNVGAVGNDLVLRDDTGDDGAANFGLHVASDWTGFTTIYTAYEPFSAGYLNWMQYAFVEPAGKVAGLGGRIRNQNYPQYVADAYLNDSRYFYWMEYWCAIDGVPVSSYDEAREVIGKNPQAPHTLGFAKNRSLPQHEVTGFALENWCTNLTVTSFAAEPVVLSYAIGDPIFTLNNASHCLRLENIVLRGQITGDGAADWALVKVESGRLELGAGTVIENAGAGVHLSGYDSVGVMEDGAVIRNCHRSSAFGYASALLIGWYASPAFDATRSPVFEMKGGVISNCVCDTVYSPQQGYGGAVYVQRATFNMTGGQIVDNRCANATAGMVMWGSDGSIRFSGDACVSNNTGAADDVYVANNSYRVCFFGDFRGHVGISNAGQTEGSYFSVRKEAGATGGNCFFPVGSGKGSGLIGATDPNDGTKLVWRQPTSMFDGVWYGSVADMTERLPSEIDLSDAAQRASLPYVVGGELSGKVRVVCTQADLDAGVALFDFGSAGKRGKIAFDLPAAYSERYTVRAVGKQYCLAPRNGMMVFLR